MLRNIRVLVVDDSALIRQLVSRALEQDPRIEIVGVARDAMQAIDKARELDPDVITLDVEMPDLTGLEALPYLLKASDARVVMLSSHSSPDITYQALAAGAVDFVTKPQAGVASSLTELSEILIKKVKTAYRVKPAKREAVHAATALTEATGVAPGTSPTRAPELRWVVAMAASTGGPPALEKVFSGLRADLPAAYLVVQHLPKGFTGSLARRLMRVSDITVADAADGVCVEPGRAYIAPHGSHMALEAPAEGSPVIKLLDTPPLHGVRPAADPLFESIAQTIGERAVGVLLTGMGSDGAQGLREMQLRGAETIAQNEATSVVWGMPGAAVRKGAARHIVPLDLVAAEIRRIVRQ